MCWFDKLWLEEALEGRTRESVRMLNTPPGESSNSRSPREGRARGSSSVPVRTSRSRRGDRFEENLPGFLSAARSNGPSEYGPVLRGRNPVRSPQAVHAPPTFFPFRQADVQAAGNLFPPLPTGASSSSVPQPPAAVVPGEQLAAQVRGLEHMMQQMTLQQQAFMQTMTASFQQQQQSLMQSMEASNSLGMLSQCLLRHLDHQVWLIIG